MKILKVKNFNMKRTPKMKKTPNKLGLYWAKLSSSWDWTLLQLISIKQVVTSGELLNTQSPKSHCVLLAS